MVSFIAFSVRERNHILFSDALDYMDKKRGFWQQSKPLYVRCWEVEGRGGQRRVNDKNNKQALDGLIRFIENEIEKMLYDLENSRPSECLHRGLHLLETIEENNLSLELM